MTASPVARLFVYGSLQPGAPNEHLLADLEGDWQPGSVRGHLVAAGWGSRLGFPALLLDPDGERVPGQLLTSLLLAERLPELDDFEGAEYRRTTTSVTLRAGRPVDAFVYVLRRD